MQLRVNGGITPELHVWLVDFLKAWPFLIWDGTFAASLGLTQADLAPLEVGHASVKDAVKALFRHDFTMAVIFNKRHNQDWILANKITDTSLMADLDRLLRSIQPVLPIPPSADASKKSAELLLPKIASTSCVASAGLPVPPPPEECIQPAKSSNEDCAYKMFPLPPLPPTLPSAPLSAKRVLSGERVVEAILQRCRPYRIRCR